MTWRLPMGSGWEAGVWLTVEAVSTPRVSITIVVKITPY